MIAILTALTLVSIALGLAAVGLAVALWRSQSRLRQRLDTLETRQGSLAVGLRANEPATTAPGTAPATPVSPSQVHPLAKPLQPAPPPRLAMSDRHERPAAVASPERETAPDRVAARPRRSGIDWERFMGVRMFAWLGGLALFLGVAYFVKYSFERDLIPPSGRVVIGLLTGLGLLAGGVRLRSREYRTTSQTLCATGVVILYAALFAGHSLYRLPWLPSAVCLMAMALVTVVAFTLAVRMSAQVIAILGLLGGFLTPVLVSSGSDQPGALFSYVALLDIGLLAVAWRRQWDHLGILGAVGTALMELAWLARFFDADRMGVAWIILAFFNALFVGAAVITRKAWRSRHWLPASAALMAGFTLAFSGWMLLDGTTGARVGAIFSFVLVADLALFAVAILDRKLAAIHGAAGCLVFGYLTYWQGRYLSPESLPWALGLTVVFALLHTVVPLALGRRFPGLVGSRLTQAFPSIALAVLTVPLLRLPSVSLALWPAIFVVDMAALILAVWVGAAFGVIITLLLNGVALALWIQGLEDGRVGGLGGALFLMTLVSVVFVVGGAGLARWRRDWTRDASATAPGGVGHGPGEARGLSEVVPVVAVLMPFFLLSQMAAGLRLAEPSPLFAVSMVMVLAILAMTVLFRLGTLPLLGVAGQALLQEVWAGATLPVAGNPVWVAVWSLAFHGVFMAFPFLLRARIEGHRAPWVAAALSGLPAFWLIYRLTRQFWPTEVPGLVPLAFALAPAFGAWWLARRLADTDADWAGKAAWLGGTSLFFLTAALPIQFERQWLTMGLAAEGAALIWLHRKVPHRGLPFVGIGLLATSFVRLTLNPWLLGDALRGPVPILNTWLATFGWVAAACCVGAWWLPATHRAWRRWNLRAVLVTLGILLVFALVNLEIADFFTPVGERVGFALTRHFARDMTYTMAWALFALGLVGGGIAFRLAGARWSGLGLLAVALAKLFLRDLSRLDQLYRVGALVGVALVAITASVLYQRFVARETRDGDTDTSRAGPSASRDSTSQM